MIKEFKNITKKDLAYMQTHRVTVTEKLDMIYFKVVITDSDVYTLNSKNKQIGKVDCIVNSIYKDIVDFVDNNIKSRYDELYNEFGNCDCGFFYKPVPKTCTITYDNCTDRFILGNLYTSTKKLNDADKFASMIGVSVLKPICVKDCICKFDDINNCLDIASRMTDGKTWSGNDIDKIEGIILSCGKMNYKITITDTTPNIEKTTKKLYRDTILENFCHVIDNNNKETEDILNSDKDYLDKVYDLFLEYINKTNIFTKMYIEDEDLLPPNSGYIGDIDYDSLPSTVRLVCKGNSTYKNILRILLITFNRSVFDNKFKNFNPETRAKLTYILSKINRENQ